MDRLSRHEGSGRGNKTRPPLIDADVPVIQAHVRVPDSVDRSEWLKRQSRRRYSTDGGGNHTPVLNTRPSSSSGACRRLSVSPSPRDRLMSLDSSSSSLSTPSSRHRRMSMDSSSSLATPRLRDRRMSMDSSSSLATDASHLAVVSTRPRQGSMDDGLRVRRAITDAAADRDRRRLSRASGPRASPIPPPPTSGRATLPSPSPSSSSSVPSARCAVCRAEFTRYIRPHRCRSCGKAVCAMCSPARIPKRTCKRCAGDFCVPRVVPEVPSRGELVVPSRRELVAPCARTTQTAGVAARPARWSVGSSGRVMVGASSNAVAIIKAAWGAARSPTIDFGRTVEVGRRGVENSSSLGVAENGRGGGSDSVDHVGRKELASANSQVGVDKEVEADVSIKMDVDGDGKTTCWNSLEGREVEGSNSVSGLSAQQVEGLDSGNGGRSSSTEAFGNVSRVEDVVQPSLRIVLSDYLLGPMVRDAVSSGKSLSGSAAAGWHAIRHILGQESAAADGGSTFPPNGAGGDGSRDSRMWDRGSMSSESRVEIAASPTLEGEINTKDSASIATDRGGSTIVLEAEAEVLRTSAATPQLSPSPSPFKPTETKQQHAPTHVEGLAPLVSNLGTHEPPRIESEGGPEIALLVPEFATSTDGGREVSAMLRHRWPLPEADKLDGEEEQEVSVKDPEQCRVDREVTQPKGMEGEHRENDVVERTGGDHYGADGRGNNGPEEGGEEGKEGVVAAAAGVCVGDRVGEAVTDRGTADPPLILPKVEERGGGEEGDSAGIVAVEGDSGCDRTGSDGVLAPCTEEGMEGLVDEGLVEAERESTDPLAATCTALPRGREQDEQDEDREQDEEAGGEDRNDEDRDFVPGNAEGGDGAGGDDSSAAAGAETVPEDRVGKEVTENETWSLPVTSPNCGEGGQGLGDEKVGKERREEGGETAIAAAGGATGGLGHATTLAVERQSMDSLNTTALAPEERAEQGKAADNTADGEESCGHKGAGNALATVIVRSTAREKGGGMQEGGGEAGKRAVEVMESCGREEGGDVSEPLVDGVIVSVIGRTHEERGEGDEAEQPPCTASSSHPCFAEGMKGMGMVNENTGGPTTTSGAGGEAAAAIDAPTAGVEIASTSKGAAVNSTCSVVDVPPSHGITSTSSLASGQSARGGINDWLAGLQQFFDKCGSCRR